MPKSFNEVYQLYRDLGSEGSLPSDMSLSQFSSFANDITGSDDFSSGRGNWFGQQIKKGSYWLDQGLNATHIPDITGAIGRAAFQAVGGSGDVGEKVGEGIPRGFLEYAPLIFAPEALPAKLATAGLLGGSSYAETDSPIRAGISALMPQVMGTGGKMAESLAMRMGLLNPFKMAVPEMMINGEASGNMFVGNAIEGLGQKALQFAAHQVGAIGAAEATNYAQDAIANKTWTPYSGDELYDKLLGATLGNVPYMLTGIKGIFKEGPTFIEKPTKTGPQAKEVAPEIDTANISPVQASRMQLQQQFAKERAEIGALQDPAERKRQLAAFDQKVSDSLNAFDNGGFVSPEDAPKKETDYGVPADTEPLVAANATGEKDVTFKVREKVGKDNILIHATNNEEEANKTLADLKAQGKNASIERVEKPIVNQEVLNATPETNVEDVKTPVDLAKVQKKTEVLRQVAELEDKKHAPEVAETLTQNGTPPDEAVKESVVGDSNSALEQAKAKVNKIRAKAENEIKTRQLFDDLTQKAAKNESLHPDENASKVLKESLDAVKRYEGTDKNAAVRSWGEWYDDFIGGNIEGNQPLKALEGKLGYRKNAETQVHQEVKDLVGDEKVIDFKKLRGRIVSEDGKVKDVRLANMAIEDKLVNIITDLQMGQKEADQFVDLYDKKGLDGVKEYLKTRMEMGIPDEFQAAGGNRFVLKVPAGGAFHFKLQDLIKKNEAGQLSFAGRVLDKDGAIPGQTFEAVVKKNVAKEEVNFWKLLAPEAFEGYKVNVKELADKLAQADAVQVHVYGQAGKVSAAKAELDKMTHEWVDNMPAQAKAMLDVYAGGREPDLFIEDLKQNNIDLDKAKRYRELRQETKYEDYAAGPRATHYYNDISPFDTKKYPVKRVDVVLPEKEINESDFTTYEDYLKSRGWIDSPQHRAYYDVDFRGFKNNEKRKNILWQPDNLHENLPNTLGWAMVQVVPGKDGRPVMFVGELQSRWGQTMQAQRKLAKNWPEIKTTENLPEHYRWEQMSSGEWVLYRKGIAVSESFPTKEEALTHSKEGYVAYRNEALDKLLNADHPLLSFHESLILKAVIDQAKKQGIDKVAISDGETAMMTEGHDQNLVTLGHEQFDNKDEARQKAIAVGGRLTQIGSAWHVDWNIRDPRPSQEGGMRLAYDTTLPNIMKKLVGEGRMEDFGVHKNARENLAHESHGDVGYFDTEQEARAYAGETGQVWPPDEGETEWSASTQGLGQSKGSPVFRNPDGTPKTNVTGREYDLTKLKADMAAKGQDTFSLFSALGRGEVSGSSGESVDLPNARGVFESILKKTGFDDKATQAFAQHLTDIKDLFNIQGVQIGELVNDVSGQPVMGLKRLGKLRQLWLSRGFTDANQVTGREMGMALAHELGHTIDDMLERGELPTRHAEKIKGFKDFLQNEPAKGQEFLKLMRETLPADYKELPVWDEWLKSNDPRELYANSMAMWAAGKFAGENGKAFGCIAQPEGRGFLKTLGELARRFYGAVKGVLGLKPSIGSEFFKGGVDGMIKSFDDLNSAMRDSDYMMRDLAQYAKLGSSDIFNLSTSELEQVAQNVGKRDGEEYALARAKETDRSRPSAIMVGVNNAIRTMHDVGMSVPVFKRLTAAIMEHGPMSKALANKALAPLYGGYNPTTGTISMRGPEAQETQRFYKSKNAKLNRAFSDIAQWSQTEDYPGGVITEKLINDTNPTWQGRKLKDTIAGMKPDDKRAMFDMFARLSEVHKQVALHTTEAFKENGRNYMMLFGGNALPREQWAQMPLLVRGLTEASDKALSQDPQQQLIGQKELEVVRQKIGNDEVFTKMLNDWADTTRDANELQAYFAQHPEHMSMIRVGEWKANAYHPELGQYTDALPSLDAYQKWKEDLQKQGYTKFDMPEKVQRGTHVRLNDSALELVANLESKWKDKINASALPQEIKDLMNQGTNVSGEIARMTNARDVTIPGFVKGIRGGGRKVVPGSMDMLETQRIYASMASKLNATRIMRSRMAYELTNPELEKFPSELEQIKRQTQNYLQPDSAFARGLMKFQSQFYLAGNIPTLLTNSMQSFLTMFPELVNRTGSYLKSMSYTAGAMKTVGKFNLSLIKEGLGLDKDHLAVSKMEDPEERALFKWMIDKGYWNFGSLGDLTDHDLDAATDLAKISDKGTPDKLYKKVLSPVKMFGDFGMKMFAATEHFNQRVASLAGFREARDRMGANYDRQKAFEEAREFMRATTYAGGKVNRPVLQGDLKTIGNMAYGLQGFTLGALNQAKRYISHWKGSEYLNLTPEERSNARRAATAMFGVMTAGAGVLGLPFLGSLIRLTEKATGTNITGNLYAGLNKLLGDDQEDGGGLADTILSGAVNGLLAQSGVPVDLGSRWALNGIFGLNPYDGFSSDSAFGPTGQMVSSALAGMKSAAQGDWNKVATSLSPAGIKKAVALFMNDGQIKTGAGQPIESSDFQKYAYMAGFLPQTVSKLNQFEQYKRSVGESYSAQNKVDASEILALLKENPVQAQQKVNEIATRNGESPRAVALRVAQTAAEQAFPKDFRRELSGQQAAHLSDIARAIGLQAPVAHQFAQQSYQMQLMQLLGQRPTLPSQRAMLQDAEAQPFSPFVRR